MSEELSRDQIRQQIQEAAVRQVTGNPPPDDKKPAKTITAAPTYLPMITLLLGLGGLVTCGLTSIPAVACGHVCLSKGRPKEVSAVVGLILGYLMLVPLLLIFGLGAMFGDEPNQRHQERETARTREEAVQARKAWVQGIDGKYADLVKLAEGKDTAAALSKVKEFEDHGQLDFKDVRDIKAKLDRKQLIQEQFSTWDGRHYTMTRIIKKAMHDPDSYSHVETFYWDMGDHIMVHTTYRGKNAFGAVVKNWVKAKFTIDGELIEVVDQS